MYFLCSFSIISNQDTSLSHHCFHASGLPIRLYDELLQQSVTLTKILDEAIDSLDIPESLMTYISDGKAYDEAKNIINIGDEESELTNGVVNGESYQNMDPEMMSDRDSKISNSSKKIECTKNEENGEVECNEVKNQNSEEKDGKYVIKVSYM